MEAIIYQCLFNLHGCTFKADACLTLPKIIQQKVHKLRHARSLLKFFASMIKISIGMIVMVYGYRKNVS